MTVLNNVKHPIIQKIQYPTYKTTNIASLLNIRQRCSDCKATFETKNSIDLSPLLVPFPADHSLTPSHLIVVVVLLSSRVVFLSSFVIHVLIGLALDP